MTWPPPRPQPHRVAPRPWHPPDPPDDSLKHIDRLLYIVVDEVVEDWVGLSVSQWPDADASGRLRFDSSLGPLEIGTTKESLVRFLKTAAKRVKSRLDVGSVFAARVKDGTARDFLSQAAGRTDEAARAFQDLAAWLEKPWDLTEQARYVAKLSYYGALLSTLPEEVGQRWRFKT